ncbi:MAG: CarD family transcriptional regulator [Lachnospiraceae bacterium]|nr:CarD family transcriptional regulator [Lachnospiraceae bacterium]
MYQINDFIIYGTHGVCRITDIGTISMPMADKNRQYYTLVPYYQKEAVIYAPVDNNKTVMRPVITKEEAKSLIEDIPNIETVWIGNERERENQYKTAIRTCE